MKNQPATLRMLTFISIASVAVVGVVALLGYFFGAVWLIDFLSSFMFQYALALLILGIILFFLDSKVMGIISMVLFIIVSIPVFSVYLGAWDSVENNNSERVMFLNVQFNNFSYDTIRGAIQKQNPDVIIMAEGRKETYEVLKELLVGYEYSGFYEGSEAFDISYFSRKKPSDVERVIFANEERPSIVLKFDSPRVHTIIGTHPVPPISQYSFDERNMQLENIAAYIAQEKTPTVLVGDLNTPPYSVHFRKLLTEGHLNDARKGQGIHLSWPIRYAGVDYIPPFLRISIDHALTTVDVIVAKRSLGGDTKSDHKPVIIDFVVE